MCFSCSCLFALYMLVFVIFSSSWRRGLVAVCDCGIPWTFLLTFYRYEFNNAVPNKLNWNKKRT